MVAAAGEIQFHVKVGARRILATPSLRCFLKVCPVDGNG
jgi:hypothetical protein